MKFDAEEVNAPKQALREPDVDVKCGSHLKTYKDLTGFPVFPPGTKSLLCKYLPKERWERMKGLCEQVPDSKGSHEFKFLEAIFSGCQNVDSGIGVYAGTADSYNVYRELFDDIIQDYHGHGPNDKHPAEGNAKLNAPDFPPDEAKMIRSTRIRVGRNLADFPLGPATLDSQRAEIEALAVKALSNMKGDLKGKYYSLESLSDKERQ